MGINPDSPLENGLELAQMSRTDQKQEVRLVSQELRDALDRVDSLRSNNLLAVCDRKARALPILDEFDDCMKSYMKRFKPWIQSGDIEVELPTSDGKEYMVKSETFTMEYKLRQMDRFQQLMLRRELINNELAKMPSMPELPEIGLAAPTQINQQFNVQVDASGNTNYDTSSDFESFKKAKETDAG